MLVGVGVLCPISYSVVNCLLVSFGGLVASVFLLFITCSYVDSVQSGFLMVLG